MGQINNVVKVLNNRNSSLYRKYCFSYLTEMFATFYDFGYN